MTIQVQVKKSKQKKSDMFDMATYRSGKIIVDLYVCAFKAYDFKVLQSSSNLL
jgi:hypothetical protein